MNMGPPNPILYPRLFCERLERLVVTANDRFQRRANLSGPLRIRRG